MDKLSLLKQFVVSVEQGGFAAAANHLGLSPSTLSKGMARLEEHLNFKLFHRSTRQVSLTEAGSRYLITARQILMELEQCEQRIQQANDEPKGRIKVNLPVSYGRLYVMPLLQRFIQQYPEIELELSFNDSYVDMLEQGIDLTIRSGSLEDRRLVARKLSPVDFLICAAPDYLTKNGCPTTAAEFSDHPWIRFRYRQTGRLMPVTMPDGDDEQNYDPGQQFIVDDGEALAELCAQGLGLTQLPHFIARDWLKDGRIVPILPYHRPQGHGVYCIYPKREYLPAKVRVLVEFMIQQIEANGESAYRTWVEELDSDWDK
ncbi:LysR family transcriptional regulator [Amphritea balenae]|uniref:LysR family transcriptional regulator n=1 Tax=Amphritea balenae TaxID=452629 RepID=A0A3P1SX51_9GAMM|nr:LysR family transcriptional regulator [Amphritea balenae]RRD01720.1 LysR family transcriptional regulator [Amphritea balenae]GGK54694.1 transcriptional regulator [Amphritea balenae]